MGATRGLLVLLAWACAACVSYERHHDLEQHVVAFDANGRAVRPLKRSVRLKPDVEQGRESLPLYVDRLLDHVDEGCGADDGAPDDVRRVLVHVHGGLNSPQDALDQTDRILCAMQREHPGEPAPHAIFVHWPSGPIGSVRDHLLLHRQGRRAKYFGPLTSPIVFVVDIATGLVRAPVTTMYQYSLDAAHAMKTGFDADVLPSWRNAERIEEAERKAARKDPDGAFDLALGEYSRGWASQGFRFVTYWLTQIVKLPVQILVLDGMGRGAWDAMLWRTRTLFWRPGAFDARTQETRAEIRENNRSDPTGHLALVLRTLRDHLRRRVDEKDGGRPRRYELVLVGHSMGAIVLDRALELGLFDYRPDDPVQVTDIVFMGAACSIQDAADAVVPYLEQHEETRFHVLTLHPQAEADEINAGDMVPRGSLLEWIDNWYTKPASHVDRRLGKWVNVVQALPLFAPVRDRVSFKAFTVDGDTLPQKHGQFNEIPFWRPSTWSTDGVMAYGPDWLGDAPPCPAPLAPDA